MDCVSFCSLFITMFLNAFRFVDDHHWNRRESRYLNSSKMDRMNLPISIIQSPNFQFQSRFFVSRSFPFDRLFVINVEVTNYKFIVCKFLRRFCFPFSFLNFWFGLNLNWNNFVSVCILNCIASNDAESLVS